MPCSNSSSVRGAPIHRHAGSKRRERAGRRGRHWTSQRFGTQLYSCARQPCRTPLLRLRRNADLKLWPLAAATSASGCALLALLGERVWSFWALMHAGRPSWKWLGFVSAVIFAFAVFALPSSLASTRVSRVSLCVWTLQPVGIWPASVSPC